jgi:hypothetical protein
MPDPYAWPPMATQADLDAIGHRLQALEARLALAANKPAQPAVEAMEATTDPGEGEDTAETAQGESGALAVAIAAARAAVDAMIRNGAKPHAGYGGIRYPLRSWVTREAARAAIDAWEAERTAARDPYKTGRCDECRQPVVIERVDASFTPDKPETIPGRWFCRTPGCVRSGIPGVHAGPTAVGM